MSSPVIGDDGFFSCPSSQATRAAGAAPPKAAGWSSAALLQPCPLTVPLLCCPARRRLQVKRPDQIQRRLAQAQLLHRRPQVDHASLLAAAALEAAEHVLVQVDAERSPSPVA